MAGAARQQCVSETSNPNDGEKMVESLVEMAGYFFNPGKLVGMAWQKMTVMVMSSKLSDLERQTIHPRENNWAAWQCVSVSELVACPPAIMRRRRKENPGPLSQLSAGRRRERQGKASDEGGQKKIRHPKMAY